MDVPTKPRNRGGGGAHGGDRPPKSKSGVPRITMSWTRENYDHITVMAALKGMSMTAYVNTLVDADRERNGGVVRRARELAEEIS